MKLLSFAFLLLVGVLVVARPQNDVSETQDATNLDTTTETILMIPPEWTMNLTELAGAILEAAKNGTEVDPKCWWWFWWPGYYSYGYNNYYWG